MKRILGLTIFLAGCGGAAFEPLSTDPPVEAASQDAPLEAGAPEAAVEASAPQVEASTPCVFDLSDVGAKDFRISFTLTTTATSSMALVNQRSTCSSSMEWDVFMSPGFGIQFETDDGAGGRQFVIGGGPLNDGQPHRVSAGRTDGVIWVQTDTTGSEHIPDPDVIEKLPPLVIGVDPCTGVNPLEGAITNLCLTLN